MLNQIITLLTWLVGACTAVLVLAACGTAGALLSADALEPTRASLEVLMSRGDISPELYAQLIESLGNATVPGYGWPNLGEDALKMISTLVFGYFGIRQWRGSPAARKGEAPHIPPS